MPNTRKKIVGGKKYGEGTFGVVSDAEDVCKNVPNLQLITKNNKQTTLYQPFPTDIVLKTFKKPVKERNELDEEFNANTNLQNLLTLEQIKKLTIFYTYNNDIVALTKCNEAYAIPYTKFDGDVFSLITRRPTSDGDQLSFHHLLKMMLNVSKFLAIIETSHLHHWDIKPSNILYKREQSGDYDFRLADYAGMSPTMQNSITTWSYDPSSYDDCKWIIMAKCYLTPDDLIPMDNWIKSNRSNNKNGFNYDLYSLAITLAECIPYVIWSDRNNIINLFKNLIKFHTFAEVVNYIESLQTPTVATPTVATPTIVATPIPNASLLHLEQTAAVAQKTWSKLQYESGKPFVAEFNTKFASLLNEWMTGILNGTVKSPFDEIEARKNDAQRAKAEMAKQIGNFFDLQLSRNEMDERIGNFFDENVRRNGGSQKTTKQYVVYNGHRYIIRKQNKRLYINVQSKPVLLSDIKGNYKRLQST